MQSQRSLHPLVWPALIVNAIAVAYYSYRTLAEFPALFDSIVSGSFRLVELVTSFVGVHAFGFLLAWFFGRPSTHVVGTKFHRGLNLFVGFWVVCAVVSFVGLVIRTGGYLSVVSGVFFWALHFLSGLVSIRLLWLVIPERRAPDRPVSPIDPVLAAGLAFAAVFALVNPFDLSLEFPASTISLVAAAIEVVPIIAVGALLWLLASPHPRGQSRGPKGKVLAGLVALEPVIDLVVIAVSEPDRFAFDPVQWLLTSLGSFVIAYLAFGAWSHAEDEASGGADQWGIRPEVSQLGG